jgi:hypothetical protein
MFCFSRLCCCKSLCGATDEALHKKNDDDGRNPEEAGLLNNQGEARESAHLSDALTEEQLQRLVDDQMHNLKKLDLSISATTSTPAKCKDRSVLRSPINERERRTVVGEQSSVSTDPTSVQLDPSENIAAMEADLDKFLAQMESTEPATGSNSAGAPVSDDREVTAWAPAKDEAGAASSTSESEDRGEPEAKGGEDPAPANEAGMGKLSKKQRRQMKKRAAKAAKKALARKATDDAVDEIGPDGIIDC